MVDVARELTNMDAIIERMRIQMLQINAEKTHAQSLIRTQLDISYILCRAIDIDAALNQCTERIVRNTPYTSGAIYLMGRDGDYRISLEYHIPAHLLGCYPRFGADADVVRFVEGGEAYFGPYAPFMDMMGYTSDPIKDEQRQIAILPMASNRGTEGALVLITDTAFECDDTLRDALVAIASNMASSIAKIRVMHDLRESSVQLKLLSDHASDAMVIVNKGRIVRANQTMASLLGMESEALRDNRIDQYVAQQQNGEIVLTDISGQQHLVDGGAHYLNRVNGYEDCVVWTLRPTSRE